MFDEIEYENDFAIFREATTTLTIIRPGNNVELGYLFSAFIVDITNDAALFRCELIK